MGIYSRDYMKRPPDDEDGSHDEDRPARPRGAAAENFLNRFLEKHPRCFTWIGLGLAGLILIGFILVKAAPGS